MSFCLYFTGGEIPQFGDAGHNNSLNPLILRIQATPAPSNPLPDVTLKTPLRVSPSTHLQEELAQRFGDGVRIVPVE